MRWSCHVSPPKADNVVAFLPLADHAKNQLEYMYFVYVLHSASTNKFYIGSSADPENRLKSHQAGKVRSSKSGRPWVRVLLEEHLDRAVAEKRERYLKSGWGRRELKKIL